MRNEAQVKEGAEAFTFTLPDHRTISIHHNNHMVEDLEMADYIEEVGIDFPNVEEKEKCLASNDLWEMQWDTCDPADAQTYAIGAASLQELVLYAVFCKETL